MYNHGIYSERQLREANAKEEAQVWPSFLISKKGNLSRRLCVKSEATASDISMCENANFFLAIFREKRSQRKFSIVI